MKVKEEIGAHIGWLSSRNRPPLSLLLQPAALPHPQSLSLTPSMCYQLIRLLLSHDDNRLHCCVQKHPNFGWLPSLLHSSPKDPCGTFYKAVTVALGTLKRKEGRVHTHSRRKSCIAVKEKTTNTVIISVVSTGWSKNERHTQWCERNLAASQYKRWKALEDDNFSPSASKM